MQKRRWGEDLKAVKGGWGGGLLVQKGLLFACIMYREAFVLGKKCPFINFQSQNIFL